MKDTPHRTPKQAPARGSAGENARIIQEAGPDERLDLLQSICPGLTPEHLDRIARATEN